MPNHTKKQVKSEAARLAGISKGFLTVARVQKTPGAYAAARWAGAVYSAWTSKYNAPKHSGYGSRAGQRQHAEMRAQHGPGVPSAQPKITWSPS